MTLPEMNAVKDSGIIQGINYTFIESDTFYSFRGSFNTKIDIHCLMDISYNLKHKRNYNKASDIHLISENKNWYVSRYTLKKFVLFENKSDWVTSRDTLRNMVDFRMLRSKSNLGIANIITSSFGHYRFYPSKQGYRVEYYQECHLVKSDLARLYLENVRHEILNYITDYRNYLYGACRKAP